MSLVIVLSMDHYSSACNTRDLLVWVKFMNTTTLHYLPPGSAFYHGAHLVFLDALGCGWSGNMKDGATTFLQSLVEGNGVSLSTGSEVEEVSAMDIAPEEVFGISPFFIKRGTSIWSLMS